MKEAQLALVAIASGAATTLAKALPAIRMEMLTFEERLTLIMELNAAKGALAAFTPKPNPTPEN